MNAPRPLALFLPALAGGGAERVMLDLAAAFVARGVTVDLVVATPGGALRSEVPDGVALHDLGAARTLAAAHALVRYLRRARPSALLATLAHANVVAAWAAGFAPGTRLVLREANTASSDQGAEGALGRAMRFAMRLAYRRAAAVVAVSDGVAADLRSHLDVPDARLHVIANPVLTPRVATGALRTPGHPWLSDGGPPVVLAVGRLAPQKDFAMLVRAFARVRATTPCRLLVLGEGPERARLEALAAELGVATDVAWPGFDPNPFAAMAHAAVFALSSAWEGLPNVLIQARSLGTPVVATDCPSGPREVLDGGALGALVPVGDDAAFARALADALRSPRLATSAAWRARYDADAIALQYLDVLGVRP
jgi:glycosyltransferase involved in cell wall biosynthesis